MSDKIEPSHDSSDRVVSQQRIIDLFGTIDYDVAYDYKVERKGKIS